MNTTILDIDRSKPFNPSEFIGDGWSISNWSSTLATALTRIDWNKVEFAICLKPGESKITGHEKRSRLPGIELDAWVCEALWLDYESNGRGSILEWLWRKKGITYLDFFGTILCKDNAGYPKRILYLQRDSRYESGSWEWHVRSIEGPDWGAGNFSAILDPKDA